MQVNVKLILELSSQLGKEHKVPTVYETDESKNYSQYNCEEKIWLLNEQAGVLAILCTYIHMVPSVNLCCIIKLGT
jgi:hypothetical protein